MNDFTGVQITETRLGDARGVVEGPTLTNMKPHLSTTDEFVYSFDIRLKGEPSKARSAAWALIPPLIDSLPEALKEGMNAGYLMMSSAIQNANAEKKELAERHNAVYIEQQKWEKLNVDLEAKIAESKAEAQKLARIKKDWKLRLEASITRRVESRRCNAVIEANRLRRELAVIKREHAQLKNALAVVGSALFKE
jgi:PHD/YefM family antitoxin component YafN of YafNO toxin-antitoxin module